MLYHISCILKHYYSWFNVLHYVSVRAIASLLSTLSIFFLFGDTFIDKSKMLFQSKSRSWTPERHRVKDNLPTMGGLFIIGAVCMNALLWTDLTDPYVWIFLVNLVGFGIIGACDDWYKIKYHKGIRARTKFIWQIMIAVFVTSMLMYIMHNTILVMPFFKHMQPSMGWWYLVWAPFILVGTSNAVNLTDGLDGLAIGSLLPNFALFGVLSYCAGHSIIAHYLHIPFTGTSEVAVLSAILIGSSLGFLWYNTYPAQIFMGDVGSLALGASLALIALMAKQELLLSLSGGLFVVETLSVIIQVSAVKWLGRRIFKMAPIHHHFELLGWQESKITARFGIISLILCLLALITIKIR